MLSVDKAGTIQLLNLREHIYRPLLYVDVEGEVIAKPTALNDGESRFVKDLSAWCRDGADGLLDGRQLHLLRNQVRGRGVGFFEAGNFYPDFMMWIVEEGLQRLVFVDPKGIVRAVDHYRTTDFGLYMARVVDGHPNIGYFRSWLLPDWGLRVGRWKAANARASLLSQPFARASPSAASASWAASSASALSRSRSVGASSIGQVSAESGRRRVQRRTSSGSKRACTSCQNGLASRGLPSSSAASRTR